MANGMRTNTSAEYIRRNVVIMLSTGFMKGFLFGYLSWFLPLAVFEKSNVEGFSVVFMVSMLGAFVASTAGGLLADSIGRKWSLIISDIILLIALLNLSYQIPVVATILYYIAEALPTAASFVLRAESVPDRFRGKFIGLGPYISSVSRALGSAFLGFMGLIIDVNALMLAMILAIIIQRLFLIETLPQKAGSWKPRQISMNLSISFLRENARLFLFSTLLGISGTSMIYLVPFLSSVVRMDKAQFITLMSLIQGVRLVTYMPQMHLIDTLKNMKLLRYASVALLLDSIAVIIFSILSPIYVIAAWLILVPALMTPLYKPAINIYVVRTRVNDRAMLVGALHAADSLASLTLPLVAFSWQLNAIMAFALFNSIPKVLAAVMLISMAKQR